MAQRGKKPIPTQLKIVKGTDQPCRIRKDEPKPKFDKIEPPKELNGVALEQWEVIVEQLQESKIISNIDVPALAMYCVAYSRWVYANQQIMESGCVVKNKEGIIMQSPFFHVANKSFAQMKSLLVEFGMTPSSRTRIAEVKIETADDEFDF